MIVVNEYQSQRGYYESELDGVLRAKPVAEIRGQGGGHHQELHGWIAERDSRPAEPATAQQEQIAQDRDVVIGGDRFPAGGTSRGREDDGAISRQAIDQDVDKASPDEPPGGCQSRSQPRQLLEH